MTETTTYADPFFGAAVSVFATTFGTAVQRREPRTFEPTITAVIGFSGKLVGSMILDLSEQVAIEATRAMLGGGGEPTPDDVLDATGELANIIAGTAKTALAEFSLSMGLPSLVTGKGHSVQFLKQVELETILLTCEWGDLAIQVGLGPHNN
ncbi:MAG: chemotaxis protein CheX [Planctomycetaceae bacterium]|nr:chemotaxis protein CheX [Planctomycetales bacterium]MCB9927746.1 chemotaxis protein CheX [Planctomycetaceae bacterium]